MNIFFKASPMWEGGVKRRMRGGFAGISRLPATAFHGGAGTPPPYAFTSGVSSFFNIRITIITQYANANAHAIGLAMQMPK